MGILISFSILSSEANKDKTSYKIALFNHLLTQEPLQFNSCVDNGSKALSMKLRIFQVCLVLITSTRLMALPSVVPRDDNPDNPTDDMCVTLCAAGILVAQCAICAAYLTYPYV
jgi:hypothetical protein